MTDHLKVADLLDKTADLIEERGLARGRLRDGDRLCTVGALICAVLDAAQGAGLSEPAGFAVKPGLISITVETHDGVDDWAAVMTEPLRVPGTPCTLGRIGDAMVSVATADDVFEAHLRDLREALGLR